MVDKLFNIMLLMYSIERLQSTLENRRLRTYGANLPFIKLDLYFFN